MSSIVVYKAGKDDFRVRVKVAGKWRVVGTFSTRVEAERYRDARASALKRSRAKKRSKTSMRTRKRRARASLRMRLRRLWRRLMKR